ncbi:hypothetical protein [Hwangdonia seohaensis]|uniref:Uncharacterized protein n=1 Tax=Hwangdonia seohaensis TaxID=1240727 RepID=A0ABW3RD48_9FLAO|nr:hypothetical protein [Hwangdonia seohaensis]
MVFLISLFGMAQTKDSIQPQHEVFFDKLSKDSGTWIAKNPKYDVNKPNDF